MNMTYSSNKDDTDYIVLEDNIISLRVLASDENIPNAIRNEILNIHLGITRLSLDQQYKIAIRKDSIFGSWLIQNTDGKTIINEDSYISHYKVQQALLVSLYAEKDKMSNKIWHLFKRDESGTIESLIGNYDETALDYILQHPSYDEYRRELAGEQKEEKYIIYDEAGCRIANIPKNNKEKSFVKK